MKAPLIKINTVFANFNNPRPSLILNNLLNLQDLSFPGFTEKLWYFPYNPENMVRTGPHTFRRPCHLNAEFWREKLLVFCACSRKSIFFVKSHYMEEINTGITNLLLLLSKEASMSSSVLSSSSSSSLSLKELMGGKGGKELKLGNGMQLMSFFCLVKKNMIR